jgi:hypothetical protein
MTAAEKWARVRGERVPINLLREPIQAPEKSDLPATSALTAQVQRTRDAGATYEQMAAMVNGFEAGQ